MYPHERSLVNRLAGKPFALLGINSDKDRAELKKVMTKENITWRSFWDGGNTQGPIASRWNVSAWPTVYVLDPKGKKLGRIVHGRPETTNIAFGGDDWKTLYFTSRNHLGSVKVKIPGIPVPVKPA